MKKSGKRSVLFVILLVIMAVSVSGVVSAFVRINEIMYDPDQGEWDEADLEWIEIFNNATETINLANWKINGTDFDDVNITAGSYVVVARDLIDANDNESFEAFYGNNDTVWNSSDASYTAVDGNFGARLKNTGAVINISNGSYTHVVDYSPFISLANGNGKTLIFYKETFIESAFINGTPGASNDQFAPDFNAWINPSVNHSFVKGLVNITVDITDVTGVSSVLVNFNNSNFSMSNDANIWYFVWDTNLNSDGSYNITVSFNDTSGFSNTDTLLNATVDNTQPVIEIVNPIDGSFVDNGKQEIGFNITDLVSGVDTSSINSGTFQYAFLGLSPLPISLITFTPITDGFFVNGTVDLTSNEVEVNITVNNAKDNAGNAIPTISWSYTIDLLNPIVKDSFVNDSDNKVNDAASINITVNATGGISGLASVSVANSSSVVMSQLSTDLWSVTTNASELGCSSNGVCTLRFTATDNAGHVNDSETLALIVDNINPSVTNIITNDADNKVKNTDAIQINVTVNDANFDTGSTVTVGNASTVAMSQLSSTLWSVTTSGSALGCSATDGACTLSFTATDIVGNINNSEKLTLTIDDIAPSVNSITINDSDNDVNNITVLEIIINVTDTNTVTDVSIEGISLSLLSGDLWSTVKQTSELCPGILDNTCLLSVTASEEVGNVNDSETLTLTVSSFAPVIAIIPDITFDEDGHNDTVNLANFITDGDTLIGDITVSALGNNSVIVEIDQTTKLLNISAKDNFNGQETLFFTASDGVHEVASNAVKVTVNPVNDAPSVPTLISPEDNSNVTTTFTTLNWSASTDVESDSITYFVFFENSTIPKFNTSTASTGIVVNNLTKGVTYFWKVIAEDGNLNSSESLTFQFLASHNTPPALSTIIQDVTWLEDTINSSIDLGQHFTDSENDVLTFTSTTPSDISVSINQTTGIVTLTPDQDFNGTNFITFTASDGINTTASNLVTLTVLDTNDAPTITSFSPTENKTIAEGSGSQRFSIIFTDIDVGDYANATWFGNTTGGIVSEIASNSSNIIITNLGEGIYNITVIVNDTSGTEARNEWILTVTTGIIFDELTSPIITGLNQSERENVTDVTINHAIFGEIDFGNKTMNFSRVANLEDAFNISNGLVSVDTETFPELNKNASIVMTGLSFTKAPLIFNTSGFESTAGADVCSDIVCTNKTYDVATGTLSFNVPRFSTYFTQTNTTNGVPVITSSPVTTAIERADYTYDVNANDPDGDVLIFSLLESPAGMSISSSSGVISWTPVAVQIGLNNVTVNVSDSNLSVTQSFNITVEEGPKLQISDIDVKVDGKKDSNLNDGDKISKEAKPGSKVIFDIEIENLFTREEDLEIEDIEVEITIEDIDDGDDLDEESKEFDIDADDNEDVDIKFNIPLDVDEDTYDVIIIVEGRDENGTHHEIKLKLRLEVEKENHEIRIIRSLLNPSKVSCQRQIALSTEIINTGADDEEDVSLEITSPELGISSLINGIELDEGTDDNRFSKIFTETISNDVLPGTYSIIMNTYYDGKLSETETINLDVMDCELFRDVREKVKEEKPEVEVLRPQVIVEPKPQAKVSFAQTEGYAFALTILVILLLGTAVFIIGAGFILLRK